MIRIILNGCSGKMGKVVSQLVKGNALCTIAAGIDKFPGSADYPVFKSLTECTESGDVLLDFSRPDSLKDILEYASLKKLPIVLCTTGYSEEQLQLIKDASMELPVFRSANMSLGVNLVNDILKSITKLLYKDFDIEIIEKHHNQKVDAPSGTALLLADTIKAAIPEETAYVYGREGSSKRQSKDIGIHAVRGGNIVGEHEILYCGQGENISIKHSALSRDVFAVGAIKACEFMAGKPKGFYSMEDVIKDSIK